MPGTIFNQPTNIMKKFIIERNIPGAGNMSKEELAAITATSCGVVEDMNKPYHWIQSYVTDNKVYCVHIAEDEATVREHAERGGFPVDHIEEVQEIIDPTFAA